VKQLLQQDLVAPSELSTCPMAHRVELSCGRRTGMFLPVSCGGSCAPANLWWEQNGVMYPIQIKLKSSTTEKEQERILVETANSTVTTQRKLKRTISSSTLREPASLRSDGVRDHPGMPFGFPPEYAFSFAGIPIAKS